MSEAPQARPAQERTVLNYGAVSSVHRDDADRQRVLLSTSAEYAGARADVRIRDVTLFREALSTFFAVASRSYRYQASSPDTNTLYNEFRHRLKEARPGESRRLFYGFLREKDPWAEMILDPMVTVASDGITLEAFDVDGRLYAALRVDADAYEAEGEGAVSFGTSFFDMGTDLLATAQLMRGGGGEGRLVVGAEAEAYPEDYRGEILKSLNVDPAWLRASLQLQATLTLPGRRFSLSRMDLYNMLRHLRLNKTRRGDSKAVRFELVPGMSPRLTLEPWEWQYDCTGPAYEGARSEVLRLWDRDDLFVLDRLLPYVERVDVHSCGEAQPTFWMVRCGSVTLTLGSAGFRRRNWSRGMLLDIELPRAGDAGAEVTQVLSALPEDGSAQTSRELAESTGLEVEVVESALRRLSQDGEVIGDIALDAFRRRVFPVASSMLGDLVYRNEREARAYALTSALEHESKWLASGEIEATGKCTDAERNNAVYEPSFLLRADGALRRPKCTCSFSLDAENKGLPCEHIMALWVAYQQRRRSLDPSQIEVAHSTLLKRLPRGVEVHEVALRNRRLEEHWEIKGQGQPRRSLLLFPDVSAAREAYLKRVKYLRGHGYLDASGT